MKCKQFFFVKAVFVGIIVTFSSLCHFTSLLAFFYICNKATKYKQSEKRKLEDNFKKCISLNLN